jgi:leucyl aminopeptidase
MRLTPMNIKAVQGELKEAEYRHIVEPCFEGLEFMENSSVKNKDLLEKIGFKGKEKTYASLPSGNSVHVYVGLGKREKFSIEIMRRSYSKAIKAVAEMGAKEIAIIPPAIENSAFETAYTVAITLYDFDTYRAKKRKFSVENVFIRTDDTQGLKEGSVAGECTNFTREMANQPPSIGTPTLFEIKAKEIKGLQVTVLGREEFIKLGMGGIEGVSRAAKEPAKMVIMEYNGSDEKPLLLVGKGITFDSGGLSLKPPDGMVDMKFDKCGAAAVLGIMKLASELSLKKHLVGIMALTENLPGGNAYKPGDILKHYNGKTSEIISTDAEGRLVLSDSLAYGIEKFAPSRVLDFATLTGACVVALGNIYAGMMGNDDAFMKELVQASGKTWENVWRLPLDDDFKEQISSKVADIKNTGGRPGGAETAAAFLSNFVGETPWVHLDIAGTAWTEPTTPHVSYLPDGATGFGVRLIYEYLKQKN